jgi:protein-S-isoprenylcysteine O-methyltransferase Ste14
MVRLGGWLFKRRTWLPLPLALAILLIPGPEPVSAVWLSAGVVLVASGELLRLWGVRHIGVISRTRSDRLGPLVASGPFAYTRNPLYIGNIALWVGFALCAGLVWLAIAIAVTLGAAYHAVVLWEEQLLENRLGDSYRTYAARVPRWLPRSVEGKTTGAHSNAGPGAATFTWRETLFSERGTLIAIATAFVLLSIKARS